MEKLIFFFKDFKEPVATLYSGHGQPTRESETARVESKWFITQNGLNSKSDSETALKSVDFDIVRHLGGSVTGSVEVPSGFVGRRWRSANHNIVSSACVPTAELPAEPFSIQFNIHFNIIIYNAQMVSQRAKSRRGSRILQGRVSNPSERGTAPPNYFDPCYRNQTIFWP